MYALTLNVTLTRPHTNNRNYCADVHAMGTRPLRSRIHWGTKVGKWRKKEPYTALGRLLLDFDAGYRQWDCFLFEDFRIRSLLIRTFEVRHLPLSDGRDELHFGGAFKFDWEIHHYEPAKRKSKAESYVKKEPRIHEPAAEQTGPRMVFDVELDKLVPLE